MQRVFRIPQATKAGDNYARRIVTTIEERYSEEKPVTSNDVAPLLLSLRALTPHAFS